MNGEECFSLEELALEAFLDSFDCDPLQQFPSEPSDGSASETAEATAQAAKRKRPRSGSTSASDDSGHAFPVFTPVFPPELSDEFLAKSIAEETERNLKAMNINPDSKEGKKQKRLIRNRMSAQLHRERKREHLKQLEQQLAAKDELIQALQAQVQVLEHENAQLRLSLGQSDFGTAGRGGGGGGGGARAGVTLFSVFAMVCCVVVWLDPSARWANGGTPQYSSSSGAIVPFSGGAASQAVVVRPQGRVLLSAPYDDQHQSASAVVASNSDWRRVTGYYGGSHASNGLTVVSPSTYHKQQHHHQSPQQHHTFEYDVKPLWQYSTSLDIYPRWQEHIEATHEARPVSVDDEQSSSSNATDARHDWNEKSRLRRRKPSARATTASTNTHTRTAETAPHAPVQIVEQPVQRVVAPAAVSEPSFVACTSATTSLSQAILPTRGPSVNPVTPARPTSSSTSSSSSSSSSASSSTSTTSSSSSEFALVPSLVPQSSSAVSMPHHTTPASTTDPTLLMVLPANSIRWRSDGSHMMFDMKSPSQDATGGALHDIIENFTVGEQPAEADKLQDDIWVEIRCKILQARLLNNVEIKQLQ